MLGIVIVVLLLLLITYELHKDNNVLGVVVVLFAKLHCTQVKNIAKNKTKGGLPSSSCSPFHSPEGPPLFLQFTLFKFCKFKMNEIQILIQAKSKN